MEQSVKKGIFFSLLCSVVIGIHLIFSKLALETLDPSVCVAYLMSFAAAFAIRGGLGGSWKKDLNPHALFYLILHSLLALVGITFAWLGMETLNPTVAGFIARVEVLVSVGLALLLLKERLFFMAMVGFAFSLVGVLLMSMPTFSLGGMAGAFQQRGVIYILISAIGFGGCEFFAKRALEFFAIPRFMVLRNALIMIACWVLALMSVPVHEMGLSKWETVYIMMAALTGPYLGRKFFMMSMQHIPLSLTVGLNQTQPLFAAFFGLAAGMALPDWHQWIGGSLIVAGCLMMIERPGRVPSTFLLQRATALARQKR